MFGVLSPRTQDPVLLPEGVLVMGTMFVREREKIGAILSQFEGRVTSVRCDARGRLYVTKSTVPYGYVQVVEQC